jgi:sporulation protein YlmC with PRC-barrel domain
MLRNVKDLRGYAIRATDGVIGKVDDLYFDDEDWAIRYLVVDTGGWLAGRKVLISPLAIGQPDWLERVLPVSLTRAKVEHAPDIDTTKPVSRQHETTYFGYYGYPLYWLGGVGPGPTPTEQAPDDCHLRSCHTVTGYHVHAKDGDIGHVADLLVDDQTWAIRYLIIDTSNWWIGHKVLVGPQWIDNVSFPDAKVSVDLTRVAVKTAPPYDAAVQLDRQREQAIFEHYGRAGYWTPDAVDDAAKQSDKYGSLG